MNARQLAKLGVPELCMNAAIQLVQDVAKKNRTVERDARQNIKMVIASVVDSADVYRDHPEFGPLAQAIIEDRDFVRPDPISYETWGAEGIDENSHAQMEQACSMPNAVGAALMADAHLGYGLPIGGVLALDNAVAPYAVGVDIACRMKLSVLDMDVGRLDKAAGFDRGRDFDLFEKSIEHGTVFGVGKGHEKAQSHAVMDEDWSITGVTREGKDKAWRQLGSSGSGNHFVEFGVFTLAEDDGELGLKAGEYVALMSHSGSRGVGAAVCSTYSAMAQARLPSRYKDLGRLAWLDLDTEEGNDYWLAMNLMGDYAAANHDVIHRNVSKLLGARIISGIENHHNFAWKEVHNGKEVVVHRKGATPAGEGVLGVIPGSMADPAFVVRGKGNEASLKSASHGAGRQMSRKKGKERFNWNATRKNLEKRGVHVLSAGADEVPGVYKNIRDVMDRQQDLVSVVGEFQPRIVKMCGDGSKPED